MSTPADRQTEGVFTGWSTKTLAAQCHMQAREQLDPDFTQFMTAVGNRLVALDRTAGGGLIPTTDDVRGAIHRLTDLAQEESDPPAITKAMIWSYLHGRSEASTPPQAIETAIRIGIFNTCMQRGMSQDAAIAIVRGTMEQLCVASALAKGKDL